MANYEFIEPVAEIPKRKRRKQKMRISLIPKQIAKEIRRSGLNYVEVSFEIKKLWNTWMLEKILSSHELLKEGGLSRREELRLRRRAREVLRELACEILTSRLEPLTASEVAEELSNIRNDVLSSAGYLNAINNVIGGEVSPQQFVRDLLCICQHGLEDIEKTVSRLLTWDRSLFKTDDGLFWSRSWPPKEVFQICVQLASRYRTKDDKMKEYHKNETVSLLESGVVDFPDKGDLIQTLRRM